MTYFSVEELNTILNTHFLAVIVAVGYLVTPGVVFMILAKVNRTESKRLFSFYFILLFPHYIFSLFPFIYFNDFICLKYLFLVH